MNSIKMQRKELLKIVIDNKQKHIAEFKESVEDYKIGVVKLAKVNLKLANSGELDKIVQIKAVPQQPRSYENEYSRAIRMLELSVDDTIEVEEHIFNQLVLDEWQWKQQFAAMSNVYKSL
jgi:hypothetical protein